jgi:hypothetical protein
VLLATPTAGLIRPHIRQGIGVLAFGQSSHLSGDPHGLVLDWTHLPFSARLPSPLKERSNWTFPMLRCSEARKVRGRAYSERSGLPPHPDATSNTSETNAHGGDIGRQVRIPSLEQFLRSDTSNICI